MAGMGAAGSGCSWAGVLTMWQAWVQRVLFGGCSYHVAGMGVAGSGALGRVFKPWWQA